MPILEDGLPELVAAGITSGRLQFVVGASNAARVADFVFLCVPTPLGDDGAADMSYVEAVAREIAPRAAARARSSSTSRPSRSARRDSCNASFPNRARRATVSPSPPTRSSSAKVTRSTTSSTRTASSIGCDDPESAVRVQRALLVGRGADARHRPGVGRDDQVRVERLPRDEDLVHQRDREPVRNGRCRRRRKSRSAWATTRASVRSSCTRARATAARASRRTPLRCLHRAPVGRVRLQAARRCHRGQRGAVRTHGRQGASRGRRLARGRDDRGVGPDVQGEHRRPPRLPGGHDHRTAARRRRDDPGVRPGRGRQGGAGC